MKYRSLGRGGPRVSLLGLGTWPIGGGMGAVDEKTAADTIRAALDAGITMIDTAQGYRASEAVIGRALRGGYREKAFLATKASFDFSRRGIEAALENSLKALRVEHVDLYQIHSWNPRYPIEESMETLRRLQEQGKVLHLGVSNFTAAQMERALQAASFASNQVVYNLFDRQIEAEDIPFCRRRGIGVIVHSPLAKGLLAGKYRPGHRFPPDDERSGFPRFQGSAFAGFLETAGRLESIARRRGIRLVQLAVAWTMRDPVVSSVLVGAKDPRQLEEHLKALEVSLGEEDLQSIEGALRADAPPG